MSLPNRSTKLKVAFGYILLTALLFISIGYIYQEMKSLSGTGDDEAILSQRRHVTNQIIGQLYQAEVIGQSLSTGQIEQYYRYQRAMKQATTALDSLRTLLTDSIQLARLDTVGMLFMDKERNMRNLLKAIQDGGTDILYKQHIDELIAQQDSLLSLPHVRKKVITHTNSYIIRKKPKSFFKRLGEVFSPGKGNQGDFIDPKNPNGRNGQAVALNNKVEGCKPKDMIGIPWMLAFALRDTGWYLRNDIIWMKDNPMPESVKDRCARCYEHIFLFSKSKKYFFDYKAISEPIAPATAERLKRGMKGGNKYGKPVPGQPQPQTINRPREHGEIKDADINPLRNKRDVWKINTVPFKGGHYAAYPPKLVETCLLAGCPEGGVVLDPFMGSGTTGMVAAQMGRHFVGIELNPEYTELAYKRIGGEI